MSETHAKEGWFKRYFWSVDHKVIAMQYLITGLVMAVVGGLLAYGFRSQLAWPGESVPGFGVIQPDAYNQLVTMHGTIMVFWVAMPILLGAFGNYLLPIMIGADDMVFPRMNRLSFQVFLLSTVVLVVSFFVPGGPASAGWTMYPPLSASMDFTGVALGIDLWILAVALEFASMFLGGINFLTTTINLRAKGMTFMRLPMLVWMECIASMLFMFSAGPLVAGALMLLLDHSVGTGFFSPETGGDPLLYQHLFWFFGHPEVYVILLPALGIVMEVIPPLARKTLFGYKMIVYSVIVAGALSFIVWAHHQFISGIDPRLAFPFSVTTILISVPFAVVIFAMIATLWRGNIRFTTGMLFAVGMIVVFLVGGTTGIINGSAAADIYVHDTYYVVAHFHYTLLPATIFGLFAGLYYWAPKMFGRHMNEGLGKLHFWLTMVFFNGTFIPMFAMGMGGHHRRIADPSVFPHLAEMDGMHAFATWCTVGLLATQLVVVVNLFWSLKAGKKAERNPWNATTLEWLAASPPGHGNFDLGVPEVVRGPYEYSLPDVDEDWLPQGESPQPAPPSTSPGEAEAAA